MALCNQSQARSTDGLAQLVFGVRMNAPRSGCPINLTLEALTHPHPELRLRRWIGMAYEARFQPPRRNDVAVSANRGALSPNTGAWPAFGSTHRCESGIAMFNSNASETG